MTDIKAPKKLIEVALPLDDINEASAKEKSIRHGHPSTLHLWWARRPLATARAVIFAQLVNDPGYERHLQRGVNKKDAAVERERLFGIIRKLVLWENTNREEVLEEAREEIRRSWRETCHLNREHPRAAELFDPGKLPAFHDPFAGGGTIPLEAQRLGLEAYASDLNPVAVLINKAMIEIPPRFAGRPPVNPESQRQLRQMGTTWQGARGLAEDVRYYGQWMRDEAEKRIGHLYPKIEVTAAMTKERPDLKPYLGKSLTVIAWLWARTVKSPNPAYADIDVPLVSTFMLSTKVGKETYVKPVIEAGSFRFTVRVGKPEDAGTKLGTTAGKRAAFRCLMSGVPVSYDHIRAEGRAGRMGARLMAIVAQGERGRIYLSPTLKHEAAALEANPEWKPEMSLPDNPRDFKTPNYGLTTFGDLFTPRQLVALTTFSDLVAETRERVKVDALVAGLSDDGLPLNEASTGAAAYADEVGVYLGMAVSKLADAQSSLCRWKSTMDQSIATFGRQALPMVWDYSEANALGGMAGDPLVSIKNMMRVVDLLPPSPAGIAVQADAQSQILSEGKLVSTDPPYYDNIGYADLSDFFYVWLRRSLRSILPDLFATMAVPKSQELVATPYRHNSKETAETFFLGGMTQAMRQIAEHAHPAFPATIYYAFKQSETESAEGTASTGWETFLDAVISAGFAISGTWPMRTELGNRMVGSGTNALASSIVLVCRRRDSSAPAISRRDFIRDLNSVLPDALDEMTRGATHSPVAPVDLSQAIIGPGMAVFSKYSAVLEADGSPMAVRTALQLINRFLAEDLFDSDTQFCLNWFEEQGWSDGPFGKADVLARAKGTSVDGVRDSGVLVAGKGIVRLLRYKEYPSGWSPDEDARVPEWEVLHHLIRAQRTAGGNKAASSIAKRLPTRLAAVRQLAYRLYTLCERKGWPEDARSYNELITSWAEIDTAGSETEPAVSQYGLDFERGGDSK